MIAESNKSDLILRQEKRAALRENFLKAVNELHGEPIKILTYELTELHANFSGWKTDGTEILVKELETPANIKMPAAILRTPDILAIQFQRMVQLP